jgi:hypothetical protein
VRRTVRVLLSFSVSFMNANQMHGHRHLALGELKAFAMILLTFFTLEVEPGTKLPTMDTGRLALGLFHATSDIDVHIKRRVV